MREEPRAGDVYAWSWPSRPVGDDAYQWRGPVQAQLAPAPEPATQPVVAEAPVRIAPEPIEAIDTMPQPPIADDAAAVDVWVELPAADEAPRKGRSRRGRGKAAADRETTEVSSAEPVATEVIALEPVEPESITAAAPEPGPVAEEAGVAETPPPAQAEPARQVAEAIVESIEAPPPPRPIDANEIVAPPATPKRGWWRRGA